jgi:Mn-containing catalase
MEKRSRRRTRDLVTHVASQGLSENEIGCARISMMARGTNAPLTGRIQMRKTNPLYRSHLTCNTRPVHTVGSTTASPVTGWRGSYAPDIGHPVAAR